MQRAHLAVTGPAETFLEVAVSTRYVCQIHPEMQGTIEVTGTAAATAPTAIDDAESASVDLGSLGGIALAVTMISIASALFARSLRGTVRP